MQCGAKPLNTPNPNSNYETAGARSCSIQCGAKPLNTPTQTQTMKQQEQGVVAYSVEIKTTQYSSLQPKPKLSHLKSARA